MAVPNLEFQTLVQRRAGQLRMRNDSEKNILY
jgi:hypothetical protein